MSIFIKRKPKSLFFGLFLSAVMLSGCYNHISHKKDKLEIALDSAGDNASELVKVLKHYKYESDSLKFKAAQFLIENMIGKGHIALTKTTESGMASTFDVFDPHFQSLPGIDNINLLKRKYEDSAQSGRIYYTNPQFIEDIKTISADYLIENIDFAFKAWKMPWARKLTFDQFKEYILPYRFGYEPLERWRKRFFESGKWIYNRNGDDRIKLASIVNDSLHKIYKWYGNDHIPYYPADLSISQLAIIKCGRCQDLNMLVGNWLRSIGIPVSSEFTKYWGNSNYGGHSWIAILDTNGKFVPMNAMFDNPVRDSLPFKGAHLAKAYRQKFAINPDFYKKGGTIVNYADITHEYLSTSDYELRADTSRYKEIRISVLNGLYWKPIETGTVFKKGSIIFKNLARNILYAPIFIRKDSSSIAGVPFLIRDDGKCQYYDANPNTLVSIDLDVARFVSKLYHKNCEIIYWSDKSQRWLNTGSIRQLKINPDTLRRNKVHQYMQFEKVPTHALYRIIDKDQPINDRTCGRPFMYNNELKLYLDY